MANAFHSEQKENEDPIPSGEFQAWLNFAGPQENGSFVVSAVAATVPGPQQADMLTVENVVVETCRVEEEPGRKLHFRVRNVGASTIDRYFVNVYLLTP